MNYTKADLRKFFIAGRRYGLTENEDNTTMSFDKFFEVYSQIQEDIKEEEKARQKEALVLIMEEDAKNGMYDQHKEQWKECISQKKAELHDDDSPKTDFLGRNIEKIFTEVDIADAIYMSKVGVGSVNGSTYLTTHQIIEKLKDRKWPK